MKEKCFVFLLYHLFFLHSFSQKNENKIDSLSVMLKKAKEDTVKIKILNNLAWEYKYIDPEKALKNTDSALALGLQIRYVRGISKSLLTYGFIYKNQGEYDTALYYYSQSLKLCNVTGDKDNMSLIYNGLGMIYQEKDLSGKSFEYYQKSLKIAEEIGNKKRVAAVLNNIGAVFLEIGNYDEALGYFIKSGKYAEEIGDKSTNATVLDNMGTIYSKLRNYNKALELYQQSLKIQIELGNINKIAMCLSNIGSIFSEMQVYNTSLEYLQKALAINIKINNRILIASNLNEIGICYKNLEDYEKAKEFFMQSLEIYENLPNELGKAKTLKNIGALYSKQENYKSAIEYFEKSIEICIKQNILDILQEAYKDLSESYKESGDTIKAFDYYILYSDVKDTVLNIENIKKISELQARYETEKKEKEISNLSKEKEINIMQLDKSRNYTISMIIVAGLILILALVLYNRYSLKSKTGRLLAKKNNQLEILNKKLTESEEELKDLNSTKDKFFSIISHDIKSPLSSFRHITGYLTSSYNILNDDDKYSYIHEINKSAGQLHDLFQNLLQWSVSQRNMIKFNPKEIDLSVIVFKIIALLQPVADKKGIEIVSEVEENTLAYCDINMILTVLRNLVSNAIKFNSENGEILVKAADADGFVEVSVSDNGIGMCEEDIKKLFRIDTDYKTIGTSKEKGTGLGLILCREFVEKNGGKIWVESQVGKGSSFRFSLPQNIDKYYVT